MIPIPGRIQQRAWECCYILSQDFRHRLALADRALVETINRQGPDSIGWHYAGAVFRLWTATIEVRV